MKKKALAFAVAIGVVSAFHFLPAPVTGQTTQIAATSLPANVQAKLQLCAACHGADGNSMLPIAPSLSAQPRLFLENQMVVIREGLRDIATMRGMLDGLTDEDIVLIAKYYASQPSKATGTSPDAAKVARGAALSQKALCGTCHLPDYNGRDQMPRLRAQPEAFLNESMQQFKRGQTKGRDTMMSGVLFGMSDADISDMAHYFATRP